MSSNIDIVIAKVRRDLSKYSDAGLIDDNELYQDAVRAVKRFGNDLCERQEAIIEIKNGFGTLPDSFFSLYLAAWCEPDSYTKRGIDSHTLQSSMLYRERVEISDKWTECSDCDFQHEEKVIRENIYYESPGSVISFRYKNPKLLRLVKGIEKSVCDSACINKFRNECLYEINILGRRTVQTNFNEGTIYLQYNGLPVDSEGNIDFPDTGTGHLETYVEYHLKRRLAEQAIANNDAQGLQSLYPTYAQQENLALRNASNELKFKKLDFKNLRRKAVRYNRLEGLQYEISTPKIWL